MRLLLRLWSSDQYAAKLNKRQVIFICEGTAYLLTSHDGHKTVKEELVRIGVCATFYLPFIF